MLEYLVLLITALLHGVNLKCEIEDRDTDNLKNQIFLFQSLFLKYCLFKNNLVPLLGSVTNR